MMTAPKRVLCVDDDDDTCALLGMLLGIEGYDVVPSPTLADAEKLLKQEHFDLIILDMKLSDGSGIEFCEKLTAAGAKAPILFYTGNAEAPAEEAIKAGASGILFKPVDRNTLVQTVARVTG